MPAMKPSVGSDYSLREAASFNLEPCAAANGGGPSWLQSARLVAAVAELTSEVIRQPFF